MQTRIAVKQKDSVIEDLDPLKPNTISRIEFTQAIKGAAKVQQIGSGFTSSDTGAGSAILPAVTTTSLITDKDVPNGLLMDKISTLEAFNAHKQRMEDLSLVYQSTEKRLYKVWMTLWIEPERQYAGEYLWRWADFNHGLRNYTKDYHADIQFELCNDEECNNKLKLDEATIVRLEPENEGSISDDYFASMSQSQLGFAGTGSEVAGNLDLAERLRQANVEQRKFPILRGLIETSDSDDTSKTPNFHFIISPRQHVEERTFYIPYLMSRYTNTQRLESVPYHVAAYILVKKDADVKKNKSLYLKAKACYKEYGKPERTCDGNYIQKGPDSYSPDDTKAKTLVVRIPLVDDTQPANPPSDPKPANQPLKLTGQQTHTVNVVTKTTKDPKQKLNSITETTTTETTETRGP